MIRCKKADPDPLADLSADQVSLVQALNKVILPLQDADPTRDFTEFAPLDRVLAKAQVVGMGEGSLTGYFDVVIHFRDTSQSQLLPWNRIFPDKPIYTC